MIRIAVTGPESCGKSTLSKSLAKHFDCKGYEEYVRSYFQQHGAEYAYTDLETIATGHLNQFVNDSAQLQIIDTDFIVMKIWSVYRFGKVSGVIQNMIMNDYFDLHILCSPDIAWVEDPYRENRYDREALFKQYTTELKQYSKNFVIVKGSHEQRMSTSIDAINALLNIKTIPL